MLNKVVSFSLPRQGNALGLFPDVDTFVFRADPSLSEATEQSPAFSLNLLSLDSAAAAAAVVTDNNDMLPDQYSRPAATRSMGAGCWYGDVVGMAAAAATAFELFTAPALQSMSTRSKGVECTACELHAGDLSISRTFLQRNLRKQRANPTGELSVVLNVLCSLSQSFADFEECNFSP